MRVTRNIAAALLLLAVLGCGKQGADAPQKAGGAPAPELTGALTWLNSSELKLAALRGKVVLLHYFEYSCVNCIRTFPYIQEWLKRYGSMGLVGIGIHSPQYEFSMDPLFVQSNVQRLGLTHPIAVDSQLTIADAYKNRYWPRLLLVDKDGRIRFDHTGEGSYREAELKIQELLKEVNPAETVPVPMPMLYAVDEPGAVCYPITAELYLGRTRGNLGNPEATNSNTVVNFHLPDSRAEGRIYARGSWINYPEYLRHTTDTDELTSGIFLKYRATEVNVVMKPESIYWLKVFVKQDGKWLTKEIAGVDIKFDQEGRSYVETNSARMYQLIHRQPYGPYELELSTTSKGLSVYSFSFGTCVIPQNVDTLRQRKETPRTN